MKHELRPGTYTIAADCKAIVRGGKVMVSLKKKIKADGPDINDHSDFTP